MFVYEGRGCGFESRFSHLNFRFRTCSEQGVPWHSGSYRVWIHSETCTWHDKNIQSDTLIIAIYTWRNRYIQKRNIDSNVVNPPQLYVHGKTIADWNTPSHKDKTVITNSFFMSFKGLFNILVKLQFVQKNQNNWLKI